MKSFTTFSKLIKADYSRINNRSSNLLIILFKALFYPPLSAVINFRLSSFFYSINLKSFSKFYYLKNFREYGIDILPITKIGPGLLFPHPNGIIVSGWAAIGENCTILHQVTIGIKNLDSNLAPIIGNHCTIMSGAKILGNILISNGVVIGANAVVIKNADKNSILVGVPAKPIKNEKH